MLDSNGDGLISALKIDISKLTPEILKILTPLFCEMESLGQTLDWEDFVEAAKLLYNTLSISDKNKLLAINHKWESSKQQYVVKPKFTPEINKKSKKISVKFRNEGEAVVDSLYRRKFETDQEIQRQRDMKKNDDLLDWTFQPQLFNSGSEFKPAYHLKDLPPRTNEWVVPEGVNGGIVHYNPHNSSGGSLYRYIPHQVSCEEIKHW